MKFYMSYWSKPVYIPPHHVKPDKNNDILKNKEIMRLTTHFIKKHYKEIHLITDYEGERNLKDLGWASINTCIEDLPQDYNSAWSLGKIKSYIEICKKGDPFLHIDQDFFITRPLDKEIFNQDVVVEDREYIPKYFYNVDYFEQNCPDLFLAKNVKIDFAYRCGILGGKDLCFLFDYASSAFKLALSENNKNFFLKPLEEHIKINPNFTSSNKATFIEQYYLAASLKKWNKSPFIFWQKTYEELIKNPNHPVKDIYGKSFYSPGPGNEDFFDKMGCLHAYGSNKYLFEKMYKNKILSLI